MKVLGISGSWRKDGNTAILVKLILDRCEKEGIETEFITLSEKEIRPCTGCDLCREKKWCVIEDDDWNPIIERILESDILIIGSPTYYYDVSGHVKNFLDRTYSLWHDRKLAGRMAVAIACCADKGGARALETLEGFLSTHEFSYLGSVRGKGERAGDVLKDPRSIESANIVADRIVNLLKPSD